nr:MAG TPA: hypothetical protein [Caudoviricetes sp.]
MRRWHISSLMVNVLTLIKSLASKAERCKLQTPHDH